MRWTCHSSGVYESRSFEISVAGIDVRDSSGGNLALIPRRRCERFAFPRRGVWIVFGSVLDLDGVDGGLLIDGELASRDVEGVWGVLELPRRFEGVVGCGSEVGNEVLGVMLAEAIMSFQGRSSPESLVSC